MGYGQLGSGLQIYGFPRILVEILLVGTNKTQFLLNCENFLKVLLLGDLISVIPISSY